MAQDEQRSAGTSGRHLQVQAPRSSEWTDAKRTLFLDHLAATCNVKQSACAVGMTQHSAHALRRRDPGFAAHWSAALAAGYEHLEAKLLARALAQGDPVTAGGDPSASAADAIAGGPFDPVEARLLLGQVRATPRGVRGAGDTRLRAVKHATIEDVHTALMTRLTTLRKRVSREGA